MSANGNEIVASLYEEYGTPLRCYVQRHVPGSQLSHAEDVVQETFVRAIKHIDKGKSIDSPRAFLYKTARNLITSMFYRGWKRIEANLMLDVDEYEHVSQTGACSLEHQLSMELKLDAFCTAIEALPPRYQEAFVRRRIWGESCTEIADKMHLSEQAVSNYATLGWKLLLEYCEEHNIELNDFSVTETRKSG